MASETTETSSAITAKRGNGAGRATERGTQTEDRDAVRFAADEVRLALDSMSRSVPEVARVSRGALDDALRAIETGSDERLSAGLTLSLGLAIGLMIGGAPRVLTAVALIPIAAIGMAMVDRQARASAATRAGRAAG
jgi:hypothetical protein